MTLETALARGWAGDLPAIRWYAVHCKPRREGHADRWLRRQGYWTFYPHIRKQIYVGRRRRLTEVEEPLFSRYIFVSLRGREHESMRAINATIGVSTVVYIGGEPLEIPHGVMNEIMGRADDEGFVLQPSPAHWFKGKPGDTVQLADEAPYYGLITTLASIKDLDSKGQITIWLKFLGADREVPIQATGVATVLTRNGSKPAPHLDGDVAGGGRLLKRA